MKKEKLKVFDGLIGSYYSLKHLSNGVLSEFANITDSDLIINIHKEYILAGANAIRTNTLNANQISLKTNLQTVRAIVARGYRNAEKAIREAQKPVEIFASISQIPTHKNLDKMLEYQNIVDTFCDCSAKLFYFEYFSDTKNLSEISAYIKTKNKKNVVYVNFEISPDGFSKTGVQGHTIFAQAKEISTIDKFGFSCETGPLHVFNYLKTIPGQKNNLICMSSAGILDSQNSYYCTPQYFAEKTEESLKLGVSVVGGLNGVSPEHIRVLASHLKPVYEYKPVRFSVPKIQEESSQIIHDKNTFYCLETKKIIVGLYQSTDFQDVLESSTKFKAAGADTLTFSDSFHGRAGISSSFLSSKIKREIDTESMPLMISRNQCQDSFRSNILGMHMENIRNILAVSGDSSVAKSNSYASFSSLEMLEYIDSINKSLLYHDPIVCSVAFNPNTQDLDKEIEAAKKKIDLGAKYIISQPVFCGWAFENLQRAKKALSGAKIIAGLLPISNFENANYIRNELPSITLSNELIDSFVGLSEEQSETHALTKAVEFAKIANHFCDGFFIFSSKEKVSLICKLIREIKSLTTPAIV